MKLSYRSIFWIALAAISLPHLVFVLSHWHALPLKDGVPVGAADPDVWQRLNLVRDWIVSGHWYDHAVYRTNAPFGGIISPWTRPLDIVIAGLAWLQPDSVALDMRLQRAALLLPWIWMTLLMAGVLAHVQRYTRLPVASFAAAGLVAAMPITWNYFGLGNADHHAPMAALFIWALYGVLTPSPSRRTLIITGLLLALHMWISFEAIILIGIIYTWYGINWLCCGDRIYLQRLSLLSIAIFLASAIALMIERPPAEWFTPLYDTHSIVYVCLLMFSALLAVALKFLPGSTLRARLITASFGSFVAFGLFFLLYPEAQNGPMADATAFMRHDFLPRISEAKPVYSNPPLHIAGTMLQPIAAFLLCLLSIYSPTRRFYPREHAYGLGYFTVMLTLLYFNQQRWNYYLFPFLPVVLAPCIAALFCPNDPEMRDRWPARILRTLTETQQLVRRLPLTLLMLIGPVLLLYANSEWKTTSAEEQTQDEGRDRCFLEARRLIRSGELARILPPNATVLAPTDLGAEVLFFSNARIVASNYHREGKGIEYIWELQKTSERESLRGRLAERNIDALLLCPLIHGTAPDSVLEKIAEGTPPPAWLESITLPPLPSLKKQPATAAVVAPHVLMVKKY